MAVNISERLIAVSDIGRKRKNNEDAAYAASSQYGTILVVADGMGGHRKGEVASKYVVDELSIEFAAVRRPFTVASAKRFVHRCLKKSNKEIYKMSLAGDEYKEMGTTAVVALIASNGTYLISLGDSRCYLYSKENGLVRRTVDQTYVQLLFDKGQINKTQMETHPQKNLLVNAIGINPELSQIQEKFIDNENYDILLLCSDGLYNLVSDEEIEEILSSDCNIPTKAEKLKNLALEQGGFDNIAVALWERDYES